MVMWHLKTKKGVFWIIPLKHVNDQFLLGVNDEELAFYTGVEQAAQAVHNQVTGFLKWDCESEIQAPLHITEWIQGEPTEWVTNS